MNQSKWVKLALFFVATVLLSGCVVEGFDGRDHDRGEHHEHEHDHDRHGDHEGER